MSYFFGGFPFGMGGEDFGFGGGRGQQEPEEPKEINNTKFYEILGVPKTATYEEIRKAYRKQAKTKHPDKGGSEQEFQELQQAYEVLSDENKRKIYDKYGEEGIKEGRDNQPEGMDIFDILNGGGRRRGKRKTKSILKSFDVSLEDVYLGKEKIFEISRYRICEKCKGSGSKNPNANTKCPSCDGKGVKIVIQKLPMGIFQSQQQCSECNGEGYIIKEKDKCPECRGNKVAKKEKMIKIMLDKGAPDGKRYTFEGEADEIPDYEPGDVVVEINIKKHNKFVRKGADLLYKADITLLEALTGFKMEITHLDGRKILVKTRPGEIIKPGVLKTVEECGMPFFEAPNRFGNLFIEFNIKFPKSIDDSQASQLKTLFASSTMDVEIDKSIKETYSMTEFNESEQNTNPTGGSSRRTNRNRDYDDDDDDDDGRPRGTRCEAQ